MCCCLLRLWRMLGTSWRATGRGYDVTLHINASHLISIPEQTVYPTKEFCLILVLKLKFSHASLYSSLLNIQLEKYIMTYKGEHLNCISDFI